MNGRIVFFLQRQMNGKDWSNYEGCARATWAGWEGGKDVIEGKTSPERRDSARGLYGRICKKNLNCFLFGY